MVDVLEDHAFCPVFLAADGASAAPGTSASGTVGGSRVEGWFDESDDHVDLRALIDENSRGVLEEEGRALVKKMWGIRYYHGRGDEDSVGDKWFADQFEQASPELRDCRPMVESAVYICGCCLEHASDRLKDDAEIVATAVQDTDVAGAFRHASERLRSDQDFVLNVLRQQVHGGEVRRSSALTYGNASDALPYVSADAELRDNPDFVLSALEACSNRMYWISVLRYASVRVRDDYEVVIEAVGRDGGDQELQYVSERLRDNSEVVLTALRGELWSRDAPGYVSERLRDSKEVVLELVSENGCFLSLKYVSERLRNDAEVVKKAVGAWGKALEHASERLRDDAEVVERAVATEPHGEALEYVTERLRASKRIVMAAVTRNGVALQHASERLRDNEAVVTKAVSNTPSALQYASDRLRDSEQFVRELMRREHEGRFESWGPRTSLVNFVSKRLRCDSEFVRKCREGSVKEEVKSLCVMM